ncbi:GtrA family protein [Rhizomonospora bruguierae]|uniref:GtrA family protein n=1 Tax=Rhizomonospora bruguierae TaxID=1581705 RepID=UPI0020BE755C|nr:GtrA family protein [Micromonospora sp. NBRC 107566]
MPIARHALAKLPAPLHRLLWKHREVVKFVLVGGFCYLLTAAINYGLKLTVLAHKPVTALTIATVVASVVSYLLNREWSFRHRGGRRRHHEAVLFFLFSGLAVAVTDVPLLLARYVFHLHVPEVSRTVQEVSDFASGMILGTLLGMVFRLWAFRRWVWPEPNGRAARALRRRPVTPAATRRDAA